MDDTLRQRILSVIESKPVVLFMKGTRHFPMCGFSGTVVSILEAEQADFAEYNILQDPDLREGLKQLSGWPTYPQLYVRGKLVGGCDIIRDLHEAGELSALLKSDAAAE